MSLDDGLAELHRIHTAAQDKYTYFLLAAAGAAIAFAVQKTEDMPLSWWLLPVAGATLAWAASFYCGCKKLSWVGAATSANYILLQLRAGFHPKQPTHHQLLEAAKKDTLFAVTSNIEKAQFYSLWQFRLIILGAVLFIAWRILEMLRITQ
jgi:hypothetical protein